MSSIMVIQISGDAGQSLPDLIELSDVDAQNIAAAFYASRGLGPGEVAQRLGAAFAQTGSLRVLRQMSIPQPAEDFPPLESPPGAIPPAPGEVPQEGEPLAPLEPAPPIAPPVVDTPEP